MKALNLIHIRTLCSNESFGRDKPIHVASIDVVILAVCTTSHWLQLDPVIVICGLWHVKQCTLGYLFHRTCLLSVWVHCTIMIVHKVTET